MWKQGDLRSYFTMQRPWIWRSWSTFAQEVLEIFLGVAFFTVERFEAGVGYVEGGAVLMGGFLRGVAVDAAQPPDSDGGAEHAGHDYAVFSSSPGCQ